MTKKKHATTDICVECGSKCCRYVAVQVDEPTCKRDYDHIRWYLLHKDVNVFLDHEDEWYIEFEGECEGLAENGLCSVYHERPRICREHGSADAAVMCEYVSEESPYKIHFTDCKQYEKWLDAKKIDWRWKKLRS